MDFLLTVACVYCMYVWVGGGSREAMGVGDQQETRTIKQTTTTTTNNFPHTPHVVQNKQTWLLLFYVVASCQEYYYNWVGVWGEWWELLLHK